MNNYSLQHCTGKNTIRSFTVPRGAKYFFSLVQTQDVQALQYPAKRALLGREQKKGVQGERRILASIGI